MIALYALCTIAFAVMVIALIRDPFKKGKGKLLLKGYTIQTEDNGRQITMTVLFKNGTPVYRDDNAYDDEYDATMAVLNGYYKQLEKEYIARTRRVNYALGTRETVTKIKRTFAATLAAREVEEMMEAMK